MDDRELQKKLLESFANALYSWKHPPSFNAPTDADLVARRKAVHDYFAYDAMANAVLRSLVATAMYYHEWASLSIPERQRREIEMEMRAQQIISKFG